MKFWIARDFNNALYLHFNKPKYNDEGYFYSLNDHMHIPHQLFPEVTFENSPQQVEIKLIEKEQNMTKSEHEKFAKMFMNMPKIDYKTMWK